MKVKCADCDAMFEDYPGWEPDHVCEACFDAFDGCTLEELMSDDPEPKT